MAKKFLVVGSPVVVTGDGSRVQLSGELTAEQQKLLGEAKVGSLHASGHLQTQEQLDEADRLKADIDERRRNAQFGGGINPNYGTPSMTPEAAEKNDAPSLAEGSRPVEGDDQPSGSDWQKTPVGALGLEPRIVTSLTNAKLATAGDVIAYGELHGGLTDLEGIGEASEGQVKEALQKLASK